MMPTLPPVKAEKDARAIMAAGLGKAELEFATSLTAPLYWVIRDDKKYRARNGSAFFLDTGQGLFAVTAKLRSLSHLSISSVLRRSLRLPGAAAVLSKSWPCFSDSTLPKRARSAHPGAAEPLYRRTQSLCFLPP